MECPKCGVENKVDAGECKQCGIIFKKYKPEKQNRTAQIKDGKINTESDEKIKNTQDTNESTT